MDTGSPEARARHPRLGGGRGLLIWIVAALVPVALDRSFGTAPRSPFWWSELGLYALLVAGLRARRGGRPGWRLPLPRRAAPAAYVGLVWLFGMAYELSLTVDGTGMGGVHPDTRASFLLATGDYLMLALAALWSVRRWGLGVPATCLLAAGMSLTEALVFSGVLLALLLSPLAWAAPFYAAYYSLAYASFLALPLLLLDEERLWRSPKPRVRPGPLAILLAGFALGMGARLLWGLAWSPAVDWLFALPPNPVP